MALSITLDAGTRVLDAPIRAGQLLDAAAVAARFNNEVISCNESISVSGHLAPVLAAEPDGVRVVANTLAFLAGAAASGLEPEPRLRIGHSIGNSVYFDLQESDPGKRDALVSRIEQKMRALAAADEPILLERLSYLDALSWFNAHEPSTSLLLAHRNDRAINCVRLGEYRALYHGPLCPGAGMIRAFSLVPHMNGFALCFPEPQDPERASSFTDRPVLSEIYREYRNWGSILELSSAGALNRLASEPDAIADFVVVNEALHDRKIARIADSIAERGQSVGVVLIAGPSSSGKTTFTKKLAIQLRVLGLRPVTIGLDDYFVPRNRTPLDDAGKPDFESLGAIDVELLNQNLLDLFAGGTVDIPQFDFRIGDRHFGRQFTRLDQGSVLVMEGIHGLNPDLTPRIPPEATFRIYVSALTQLNLDYRSRIATTDNRLIRRIVRDHQFRGHSAARSLELWPNVRRGEDRNIFPFQNSADAVFNSALEYELGVLKPVVTPLLQEVKPDNPGYSEATRLLLFLKHFAPIREGMVPARSILREFLGNSAFRY